MNRGAVIFAYNNDHTDYYRMASITAARIEQHLNLPTTVITDEKSVTTDYCFDRVVYTESNSDNTRKGLTWINKNRYAVNDYSPYDHTLLIDADYVVNSSMLNRWFDYQSDFVCHDTCRFMFDNNNTERLGPSGPPIYWATAVCFKKTLRSEHIFKLINMIQDNYVHYSDIYGFGSRTYRNDYALTIALRTINGQVKSASDHAPWPLLHVPSAANVVNDGTNKYKVVYTDNNKAQYVQLQNVDFHMLNKANFMELST